MRLPTKKEIKKLSPDDAKDLLKLLEDCKMSILNNWGPDSSESYWLNNVSDECTWVDFQKEDGEFY